MASDVLKSPVTRRSGIALWRQIADAIRAGISSGLGDESGKLPPETELAALFGVNRHTVRSAISALVQEGILRAEQGRGTFIIKPERVTYPIGKRTRFSAGLAEQGQQGANRLLKEDVTEANTEVAKALGLAKGAPVLRIRTIGTGDKVPLSRSTHFFDVKRFSDFAEHYRRLESVTKAFAACGLDDYVRQSTLVEAYHATIDDIELLGLVPNAIVLVTHAINADMNGNPIQYSKTRFSADRVNLHIELGALD
ncbi:GntR family transcriptional regulator, phosphonate transport system regulatory protein [Cohaesibacter sp. ES.047]|uniref:phosphonate metabolism transcriptional regulator PhnF n=1 Tax=Cohaesibacter sp. ES.047 TaxID=1798205 RepID=UPI000BB7A14C|nr:phosphonate metabolism transcriptional regulator PhnF [Cohaesibacter sp. ES.047]SNY92855.1 GntR family transcriptional regulator, phosphonate transport system regulatory protein [Cohaesibacter sp. ES.047]